MFNEPRRSPRRKEKKRECFNCGYRTTHVYDHGYDRFICVECELHGGRGDDEDERFKEGSGYER